MDKAVAGVFSLDGTKKYKGWTFGDDWNGFDCPYFEKSVADKIAKDFNGKLKGDTYKFNLEDVEDYEKQTIDTADGKKEVWAIGAYAWVWSETGRDDKPSPAVRPTAKDLQGTPDEMLNALKQFVHAVEHEGVVSGRVVDAVKNAKEVIKRNQ